MEFAHRAHFALSSQEHGRGRICEYWALRGVLVFRLVVERPCQGTVKPSIVTRSGSQFYIFCGAFHVSAQMDVVEVHHVIDEFASSSVPLVLGLGAPALAKPLNRF